MAALAASAGEDPLAPAATDRKHLAEVIGIKEQANAKFKEGDYMSAKCLYSGALELLERCCMHMDAADATWEGLKNNMALCDLRRKGWSSVVDLTTEILKRNPSNPKALYRRGVAFSGQGKLADAQRDLRAALELEPNNAEARQRLAEVLRQSKEQQHAEREQAEKMRGFLTGERLDDTVAITQDGGVRKLHSNENAPLVPSWLKREWLVADSRSAAVVTCHIVVKTPAGKEVWTSRKPPGALSQQPVGPHMAGQAKPAERPVEPVRFVIDDAWGGVFSAWNAAAKTCQLGELARYEVSPSALGPSVESAVVRCMEKWLPETEAWRESFKDVPEDLRAGARRRQALQILGLPEEMFSGQETASESTLSMEVELMEVGEYTDLDGDGRRLLRVIKSGHAGAPVASDLSTVSAHFRIAKLLTNVSLTDTRLGLASTSDGLVMRRDPTREALEFVVGEAAAGEEGDFVPPCVGRSLLAPLGGAAPGTHFELVLRDGVPISEMEKPIFMAYAKGMLKREVAPDTSGPVVIRVEVEKVAPALRGPSDSAWNGLASVRHERERAEWLQERDDGLHWRLALRRWRRVLRWIGQLARGQSQGLAGGASVGGAASTGAGGVSAGGAEESLYDVEWDDDEVEGGASADGAKVGAEKVETEKEDDEDEEAVAEVEVERLKSLDAELLGEWAAAHAGAARLLLGAAGAPPSASSSSFAPPERRRGGPGQGDDSGAGSLGGGAQTELLAEQHSRRAVQAASLGQPLPKSLEVSARSLLATVLLLPPPASAAAAAQGATAQGGDAETARKRGERASEALEVLRPAQALEPTNQAIRDLVARASQLDQDQKSGDTLEALRKIKQELAEALDLGAADAEAPSASASRLLALLERLDALPLTWEAASGSAVGKEVGGCARHADEAVAALAKAIVGKLHKLAKQERPLWVR